MTRIRGTCIAIEGRGVLVRGASGSGKSDLAIRLLAAGASLVSDDYTDVAREHDRLVASPPAEIRGMIEVRGLGILKMDVASPVDVAVVVDLVPRDHVPRMPEEDTVDLLGVPVPHFRLAAFDASAADKVRLAVRLASGRIIRAP